MQNAMIGWQNALSAAVFAVASGGTYAGFPPSNVGLDVGGNGYAWRAAAGAFQTFTASFATAGPVRVISVHRTNLTATAVFRLILSLSGKTVYDSGNVTPGVLAGQAVFVLPAAITADNLYLAVNDPAQSQPFYSIAFAFAGPVFQPSRNWMFDSAAWGSKPQVDGFTTRSGLNFPQYRYRNRTLKLPWGNFLPSEMQTVEQMIAFADTARNLLVIPNPDAVTASPIPLFGQVTASDRGIVQGGYRSADLTVNERL